MMNSTLATLLRLVLASGLIYWTCLTLLVLAAHLGISHWEHPMYADWASMPPVRSYPLLLLRAGLFGAGYWFVASRFARKKGHHTVRPECLGEYLLHHRIGKGGFGDVYQATDAEGNLVALKVLRTKWLETEEEVDRFLQEATTLRQLQHERIVKLHGVGAADGSYYVALQYIDGLDLAQLSARRRLTHVQSASLIAEVADILDFAHSQGVIHRDIKPSNILLDQNTTPYLTDFGLAIRQTDPPAINASRAGTARYMSHEQIRGEEIDLRTDIYSLGLVLYQLLCRRKPYSEFSSKGTAESRLAFFKMIQARAIEPPSVFDPSIPALLDDICLKCIDPDRDNRYPTASSMADALRNSLAVLAPAGVEALAPPAASLLVTGGARAGERINLPSGESLIGRHPAAHIYVDHAAFSRHHARLVVGRVTTSIEDLNSRNGTCVNGQFISSRLALMHGDEFRIADVTFTYQESDALAFEESGDPAFVDDSTANVILTDDDTSSSVVSRMELGTERSGAERGITPQVKLRVLIELTQNMAKAVALEEVLPQVLDSLFRFFPQADCGFIGLTDSAGVLTPRWTKFRQEDSRETIRVSRVIANRVMSEMEAILSADASSDSRFQMSQSIADLRIRSVMCAPLVNTDGLAIGILQIDTSDERRAFTEEDLALLVSVASQATIAIENARLHESVLEQQRRQLSQQRDMALTTVHNLRNPVMLVRAAFNRIAIKYQNAEVSNSAGSDDDPVEDGLRYLSRVEEIITSILRFLKPPDMRFESHELLGIVDSASTVLHGSALHLDVNRGELDGITVDCDRELLRQVFEELMWNAAKSIDRRSGTISIRAVGAVDERSESALVRISVEDDGPGVAPEVAEHLFDPFVTNSAVGTGLGLSFVRYVISEHRGTIWHEPGDPRGARIVMELPIRRQ